MLKRSRDIQYLILDLSSFLFHQINKRNEFERNDAAATATSLKAKKKNNKYSCYNNAHFMDRVMKCGIHSSVIRQEGVSVSSVRVLFMFKPKITGLYIIEIALSGGDEPKSICISTIEGASV